MMVIFIMLKQKDMRENMIKRNGKPLKIWDINLKFGGNKLQKNMKIINILYRVVAQLGRRLVWGQEYRRCNSCSHDHFNTGMQCNLGAHKLREFRERFKSDIADHFLFIAETSLGRLGSLISSFIVVFNSNLCNHFYMPKSLSGRQHRFCKPDPLRTRGFESHLRLKYYRIKTIRNKQLAHIY